MSILTEAIYSVLAGDATLVALLSDYDGAPGVFTTDPAPGNASPPYVVTAGEVSQSPSDGKTCRGRVMIRDVRCYTAATGSSVLVEQIAERVRFLLHRQPLSIDGFNWLISDCAGPVIANETDFYGRILSLSVTARES